MKKRERINATIIALILIFFLVAAFLGIKQLWLSPTSGFEKKANIIQSPCDVCADNSECSSGKICRNGCCKNPVCGDGIVSPEVGEQCEPSQTMHPSCEIFGYFGGVLNCNDDCQYDFSDCYNFTCDYAPRVQVGLIQAAISPKLNEASGLVQSRIEPLVFWSHNDNTNDERLFAIHKNGSYLATYDLQILIPGTTTLRTARDPEDIAIGPGLQQGIQYIYFADSGDNWPDSYNDFWIWRLPEPQVNPQESFQSHTLNSSNGVELIRYKFPSDHVGKDVEAMMIDPWTNDLYFATKHSAAPAPLKLFKLPFPQLTNGTILTLQEVAQLPWSGQHILTGGDISQNGRFMILRRYPDGYIWTRNSNQTIAESIADGYDCHVTNLNQFQGEAVAFDIDNSASFYITSESNPDASPPNPPQPVFFFEKI